MISLRRRTARSSGVRAAEPVGEDDELVTAEPRHGVAVAHTPAEPPGHLDEDGVARVVPEPVVDRLEPVEVAEEHREPLGPVVPLVLRRDGVHMVVEGVVRPAGRMEVEGVPLVPGGLVRVERRVRQPRRLLADGVLPCSCSPNCPKAASIASAAAPTGSDWGR